ncbi:MAG: NAD(P)-binding domain-containing protein, partial [Planctomycetota bacterium]
MDTMSSAYQRLSQKIERGNIVAGIIGLGYVGLPLATLFAKKGIKVIGFDIDVEKIHKLLNSQS